MNKLPIPGKEVLEDLYIVKSMSLSQIAVIFNVSAMSVRSWLYKLDISVRVSNINLYHELRSVDFSTEQKSLIVGSLLGDGGLRLPKKAKNAHFYERHAKSQLDYLLWKKDKLMPFVPSKLHMETGGPHIISGVHCNTQDSYKLVTVSHPTMLEFWKIFYRGNGCKIVPENIADYFDELSLVVWLCDDGNLHISNRNARFHIHTESFSLVEQEILKALLEKYFFGRITINKRKYLSGIKYYITLSGKVFIEEFFGRIGPLVPSSMQYKIP